MDMCKAWDIRNSRKQWMGQDGFHCVMKVPLAMPYTEQALL